MKHQFVYQQSVYFAMIIFSQKPFCLCLYWNLKPRSFCFTPNLLTRQIVLHTLRGQIVVQGGIKSWGR